MTSFVKKIIAVIFLVTAFSIQAATLEIESESAYANLESPDKSVVLIIDSEDSLLQTTLTASGWKVMPHKEVEKRTDEYLECMDLTSYDSLVAKSTLRDISCQISNPAQNITNWFKRKFRKIQANRIGININDVPVALKSMQEEL